MNKMETKICGLCNQPIDNKHKFEWVEVQNGIKIQKFDCPYYIGFNGIPVVFIPHNQQEEQMLKELREDLYRREKILSKLCDKLENCILS